MANLLLIEAAKYVRYSTCSNNLQLIKRKHTEDIKQNHIKKQQNRKLMSEMKEGLFNKSVSATL